VAIDTQPSTLSIEIDPPRGIIRIDTISPALNDPTLTGPLTFGRVFRGEKEKGVNSR
jgi:hypothetical protein